MFSNFLEVNLKFGGLFVIVFCLFLITGLIPAIYLSMTMNKSNVPPVKSRQATPFTFDNF